MINTTDIESEKIPEIWGKAFLNQTIDSPIVSNDETFHIMMKGLPQTVPENFSSVLLETMALTLTASPSADSIIQPVHCKLRNLSSQTSQKIIRCRSDQISQILADGFIALVRDRLRKQIPRDMEPFSRLSEALRNSLVLAVAEPLFPTVPKSAPDSWSDRLFTFQRLAIQNVKQNLPLPIKIYLKSQLISHTSLIKDLRAKNDSENSTIAKCKTWTSAFARTDLSVKVPEPENRIPILMALHWLELGGAEKFAVDLIKAIPKERFAVYVTTDVPSANPWAMEIAPFTEEILHLTDFLPKEKAFLFYDHFIRSRRIRLMHIHHAPLAYDSLFYIRRFHPELKIIDSLHILELPPNSGGYPEHSARHMAPFLDRHHVVSHHLERFLMERWLVPQSKIDVIYLNVDTDHFDPNAVVRGTVRRTHGIPAEACLVGFIGRMVRQKRPMAFVETAELLIKMAAEAGAIFPLHFIMAGGGPMEKGLRQAVNRKGLAAHFHFHGEVSDTRPVYRDMDLLIMPSENEGLALVTYEAMAMEVPVVFTDVGAQSELLAPEYLVPDAPPLALSLARAALPLVLDRDRRRKVGQALRRHILAHHRADQTFDQILSVYDRMLAR